MRLRVVYLTVLTVLAMAAYPAARLCAETEQTQQIQQAQRIQQIQPSAPLTSPEERAELHAGPDWQQLAPHLPDPDTGSAAALETAGDVLAARRFPEDALDYYGYAMARGGNVSDLLNKMGVVRLELRQNELAREMFQRTVRVQKKDAAAWNNLGVTEFIAKEYVKAIDDYKRAMRLDSRSAVYHSNLGMAYFELKDLESARDQFAAATRLDPEIMQARPGGGISAHVLSTQNYSELCFEIAKVYAREHRAAPMRLWLAKASEGGFDVRGNMRSDTVLAPYLKDPEVKLLLANAASLHTRAVATTVQPNL